MPTMNNPYRLPPPAGYSSWLDYAVETFDTRGLEVEALLSDLPAPDRQAMREAARAELRQLRHASQPGGDASEH